MHTTHGEEHACRLGLLLRHEVVYPAKKEGSKRDQRKNYRKRGGGLSNASPRLGSPNMDQKTYCRMTGLLGRSSTTSCRVAPLYSVASVEDPPSPQFNLISPLSAVSYPSGWLAVICIPSAPCSCALVRIFPRIFRPSDSRLYIEAPPCAVPALDGLSFPL